MTDRRPFAGISSVRPRTEPVRVIVLHWTGGIARASSLDTDGDGIANHLDDDDDGDGLPDFADDDAEDCGSLDALLRVLRATKGPRTPDGLSVDAGIAADGVTEEWADDDVYTLGAGIVNPYAKSIEVCSPGYSTGRPWALEQARGVRRREYVDRIRGIRVRMLDYTTAQHDAVHALVTRWCDRLGVPRDFPRERDGSLMRRQMTPRELATFRGVIGHFHCHATKNDPGTWPLLELARRWGVPLT